MPRIIRIMAVSIVLTCVSNLCLAGKPPVVEKLDELTGVTITHSRTPLVLSPNTVFRKKQDQDFVEVGAIEVNRMGKFSYFLWLGISDGNLARDGDRQPPNMQR